MNDKKDTPPVTDDSYMIKLINMGWSADKIAKKMGRTEEAVKKRWEELLVMANANLPNGYVEMVAAFNVMLHQYQLLGESLKLQAMALSNPISIFDMKEIGIDQTLATKILGSYIVLRPFVPPTPEEALHESVKKN